ncbi:hypothetical protein CLAFUW4_06090 [Fulvia fulva]|uniref:Uncharacterized protein n=1 Tax=Passalora fulva TaxID=5499 RepID=A0A9Q8LH86_PASFU|nr:uncharacterized protein CLAFUR5_06234 [Fulvia fulva]KAK4624248.1 hypothetical protein CLAFUR4_06094 [Fulvia fulva]KAK4625657.1 hypothetical protein CLAFUR0_06098 [Fulvia fulva]UJO17407.1 hypothetical protein CLAFUR5_06234 [Fulvia fulva]WPV15386.1 hypothetical protein CLAFUW4_06090 [Fulvia fulva]WPV29957.1 hypothetical protein CLAFUW7_06087 [Fulvia fulva]
MAIMNRALRGLARQPVSRSIGSIRPFSSTFALHDTIPFHVDGQGTGVAQTVGVKDTIRTINTDAYPAFGGKNEYPSPLHFNLTALSSCTQVTGSIVAKDHGINLKDWKVSVTGQLDPAVLVGGAEGNANWTSINLDVEVATDADGAKFDKWTSEVERRCPVTQLFKRSGAEWTSKWVNKA